MAEPIPDRLLIDPALLERLGRMITVWSSIEAMIQELLGFMLEAHQGTVYALTQEISAATISGWIRQINDFRVTEGELKDHITEIVDEMS